MGHYKYPFRPAVVSIKQVLNKLHKDKNFAGHQAGVNAFFSLEHNILAENKYLVQIDNSVFTCLNTLSSSCSYNCTKADLALIYLYMFVCK